MSSKVTSVLSYFGLIGWLIAFFAGTKDDKSIYLKQGFGLILLSIVFGIVIQILVRISTSLALVGTVLWIVLLVLFILGLINAIKEEKKPLPIVGKSFEGFSFIK